MTAPLADRLLDCEPPLGTFVVDRHDHVWQRTDRLGWSVLLPVPAAALMGWDRLVALGPSVELVPVLIEQRLSLWERTR